MIGFDIDGVVMDFDLHLVNTVERMSGYRLPYPATDFYKEFPGCTQEEFKIFLQEALDTIELTEPIPGSIDTIVKIQKIFGEKIIFITSRSVIKEDVTKESLKHYINSRFDFDVFFANNEYDKNKIIQDKKGILYFVEDNVSQITKISQYIKKGFLISYPWTENAILPNNIKKVNNLEEVYSFLYNYIKIK